MNGYVSESATNSGASGPEATDTEWHSTALSVSRLAPAAEADEDLADFNFGDGAKNAAAG